MQFSRFDSDRSAAVERASANGVAMIVNIGIDLESSESAVALAEEYTTFFAAVGVHPHDAATIDGPEKWTLLRKLAAHANVVALGEMGLDYYRDLSPRKIQHEVFLRQLDMARELALPVVLHQRDAHEDMMHILKHEIAGISRCVVHCFSGDWEEARRVLDLGCFISFGGPITFRNFRYREMLRKLPMDRVFLETDCPYLAPHPYRGKRNEPAYLVEIVREFARIRGGDEEEIALETSNNAETFFKIPAR
jgi:TatD DNase family protein